MIRAKFTIGRAGWFDLSFVNLAGNYIVIDFIAGCLWGCFLDKVKFRINRWAAYFIALYLFTIANYFMSTDSPHANEYNYQTMVLLRSSFPSFFIVVILSLTVARSTIIERALSYIGCCSYSIYLSHVYFVSYTPIGIRDVVLLISRKLMISNQYANGVFMLIVAISFGILIYEFIEKPIYESIKLKKRG